MRFRSLSLAIALLATPIAAAGATVPGSLCRGRGRIQSAAECSARRSGRQLEPRGGFVGLGSVGYALGNGFRFELEGNYRQGRPGQHDGLPSVPAASVQTYGVMANALFDIDVGVAVDLSLYRRRGRLCVDPSVAKRRLHARQLPADQQSLRPDRGKLRISGNRWAVVPDPWRAGPVAHVGIPFLRRTGQRELRRHSGRGGFTGACARYPQAAAPVQSQLPARRALCLQRGGAGAGAAHPRPRPRPRPARSYLVFFDWDKATLTDRARQIVKEAADNSTRVQYTRIEVNGYTDTSGTHQYNQGLSVRRARAVQAELVKDGVPQAAIGIQGFGDTQLLVPTGPGVREPQNRRVEIVIR